MTLETDGGKTLSLRREDPQLRHVDHAWSATLHAAQGTTRDNVIAVLESGHGLPVDRAGFYVGISRARDRAVVLTDNREDLVEALEAHAGLPVTALEAVGEEIAPPAPVPLLDRMIARAGSRVAEQGRRWVRAAERPVVAHIDPGPRSVGLALGQHRHRRVVAMQAVRRQHMGRDQVVQRAQCHGAGADLVGQGGQAEVDTLARIAVALAVQRLASRAGESHPHALPEPYVSLSTHTAPSARPCPCNKVQWANRLGSAFAILASQRRA